MRRTIVIVAALALFSCQAEETAHNRLIGKWKSDDKRTLDSMNSAVGVPQEARAIFENDFFGNLIFEYKKDLVRAVNVKDKFDSGFEPYEVVKETGDSYTLKQWNEIFNESEEWTIYFSGDCYYVLTGEPEFREYFCRIE